jgi:hypothetical protein
LVGSLTGKSGKSYIVKQAAGGVPKRWGTWSTQNQIFAFDRMVEIISLSNPKKESEAFGRTK